MAQMKSAMNMHAKRYISAVFEKTLRAEGFLCPDDKYLCWYRIRNNEILDTIIFCTSDSTMPMLMDIQFEASPLYFDPISTQSVQYTRNANVRWDCIKRTSIHELVCGQNVTIAPYSADIQVYAPMEGSRGLYMLNEVVLPYFAAISTPYDCYQKHKAVHLNIDPRYKSQMFSNMSLNFTQEAIFYKDVMVYPYCINRIRKAIRMYSDLTYSKPGNQELSATLQEWKLLQSVFANGSQNEYIDILERRKVRNIALMKRKLGVDT